MSKPLVVTLCESFDAAAIWHAYQEAIGLQSLHDAYGPHWPRPLLANETVFEFGIHGVRIAWGSILHDPADRIAWHAHGIWPAYQDQGATRDVSQWLTEWAFTHLQIEAVCAKILETNPRYQAHFKKRQHDPAFAWRYAGAITMPWPGYDVYCLKRERWQLEREQRTKNMEAVTMD